MAEVSSHRKPILRNLASVVVLAILAPALLLFPVVTGWLTPSYHSALVFTEAPLGSLLLTGLSLSLAAVFVRLYFAMPYGSPSWSLRLATISLAPLLMAFAEMRAVEAALNTLGAGPSVLVEGVVWVAWGLVAIVSFVRVWLD